MLNILRFIFFQYTITLFTKHNTLSNTFFLQVKKSNKTFWKFNENFNMIKARLWKALVLIKFYEKHKKTQLLSSPVVKLYPIVFFIVLFAFCLILNLNKFHSKFWLKNPLSLILKFYFILKYEYNLTI